MPDPDAAKKVESEIKTLLLSEQLEDRKRGLELLDESYRLLGAAVVRQWSRSTGIVIPEQDLGEIWSDVVISIWGALSRGKFLEQGSLKAFVCRIAVRRAMDWWRGSRRRAEQGVDLSAAPAKLLETLNELLEVLAGGYDEMSESSLEVFSVDLQIFLASGFEWPSLAELTRGVNQRREKPLSESAVKSRRERARKALRDYLDWRL